jgi:hypothetical protein
MTKLLARLPRPTTRPSSAFGPESVEVRPRALRVGEGWCASFAVVGYPREVGSGWLEPLTAHPGRLDVAVHVDPLPAELAANRLRRQLARLESGRRADAARGRLVDPDVEVAATDARQLAAGLARGEQKLFRVGLYLTVHAPSEKALEAECTRVKALCASMLLDAQPATWRMLQGWSATLPVGLDALTRRRAFDTDALAASFPFASAGLSSSTGVLYGTTAGGSGLLLWDRFAQDNHNSVILARSGVAASDQTISSMDADQYAAGEGPCVDASTEGRRFHSESLSEEARWPDFTPKALGLGINAILSTPLLTQDHPVGAINMYSRTIQAFADRDLELAAAFATEASLILTHAGAGMSEDDLAARLAESLRAREVVAQAQGILMQREALSADEAYATLRRLAVSQDRTFAELAIEVVASSRRQAREE